MSELEEFCTQNIEGYLFSDLDELTATKAVFPTVLACFAGIELLGALIDTARFEKRSGQRYFTAYWSRFLYPRLPNTALVAEALYKHVRHGIAHSYVVKGAFGLAQGIAAPHLGRGTDGIIAIDGYQLVHRFKVVYRSELRPTIASDESLATTMQARLQELKAQYAQDAAGLRYDLFQPAIVAVGSKAVSQSIRG